MDASDLAWSLLGKSVHYILEKSEAKPGVIVERRFYGDFDGVVVGGRIDIYEPDGCRLSDYKVTSIFKINKALAGEIPDEWIWQMNINSFLMRKEGIDVRQLFIVAIARDFRQSEIHQYNAKSPIVNIPIPVIGDEEILDFLTKRIAAHKAADSGESTEEECSREERWERDPVIAVNKQGQQRAVKLFQTMEDAISWVNVQRDRNLLSISTRPGLRVRCEGYCSYKEHCKGYQKYLSNTGNK